MKSRSAVFNRFIISLHVFIWLCTANGRRRTRRVESGDIAPDEVIELDLAYHFLRIFIREL